MSILEVSRLLIKMAEVSPMQSNSPINATIKEVSKTRKFDPVKPPSQNFTGTPVNTSKILPNQTQMVNNMGGV